MTIRYAQGMSQPAVDIYCDDPHCGRFTRGFTDTGKEARWHVRQAGWLTSPNGADYCPDHG